MSDATVPHNLTEPALDQLPPDVFLRLSAAVDHMPAFPKSVEQILTLTRNVACSAKDLVQVINRDPVITVKVLRVVNSAYYGLAKQITSVDHAVVFLGLNTVKNLALSLAAVGMLPNKTLSGFDGQRYLMHSMATATLARQLAKRLPDADANDCFIAGLLHDFGKVVVAQFMPTEFRKAMELSLWRNLPLHQAMHEVIGVDHAQVGAMLAEKWHFADDLVQTIRFQHAPSQSDTPMMATVVAANQLSKWLGYEFGGWLVIEELPESVAQRLGGKLENVKDSLGDLGPLLNEAHVFSHL
ncbi:HDOD domain-containing protein [Rhodoferax sp.]|uniref:HDOD domain-containing protein n=1 Tax=Rhodoferax sp. TaxID=50421 RepID=UPI00260BE8DA|nr:HDOD domain-containing protein [Rhodoferax sp.]MDD4942450.1 HDOD domain-containing protein [Rhodoferax sp.]